MKPQYNSVVINLIAGESIREEDFPHIDGTVVGFSTHTTGDTTGKAPRVVIKQSGQEEHRPINTAFSETEGRAGFSEGIVPLEIVNPGRMSACVTVPTAIPGGESISVEVILISHKNENNNNRETC